MSVGRRDSGISLACSEVWGGRGVVRQTVELPGVLAAVFSQPCCGDIEGGDVQYLGSCSRGMLSKIILADTSGHGGAVTRVAELVERTLRGSINEPRNDRFLAMLNADLGRTREVGGPHFTTMISVTINAAAGRLWFASAAQPFLVRRVAAEERWETIDVHRENSLPLGVFDHVQYFEGRRDLAAGDLVVLTSDGVIEMGPDHERPLGMEGLLAWLADGPTAGATAVRDALCDRMAKFRGRDTFEDDVTLVVLEYQGA